VLEFTELIRKYDLKIPTDLFMMIKALVTVEGTVQLINPEMDVVTKMRPHLKRLATRRFSPESIWRGARTYLFRLGCITHPVSEAHRRYYKKMEQGRLRLGFEHQNLEGLQKTHEKTFSRLTMGVILGALIIGSSLIITAGVALIL
jgi:ubiquinone biosynthesis protein